MFGFSMALDNENIPIGVILSSAAPTVLFVILLNTGDDNLAGLWAASLAIYVFFLIKQLYYKDGRRLMLMSLGQSAIFSFFIWVAYFLLFGHPWDWHSGQFLLISLLPLIPPTIMLSSDQLQRFSVRETISLRTGAVLSFPICLAMCIPAIVAMEILTV